MPESPFIGELCIFPYTFVPRGWAACNGQLMPLSQNTALFAIVGTTYGGDGKSTFGLPDLRGMVPMHPYQGPGLSSHFLGEQGGADTVTLLTSEVPAHVHSLNANAAQADLQSPSPSRTLARSSGGPAYATPNNLQPMAPEALTAAGAGLPHNTRMPYLTLRICIALQGILPPHP